MTRPLALITGATAGIGAQFCRSLAARGYDLVGVARDGARLDALATELAPLGATLTPLVADLSTDDGIARVESTLADGHVSLLVNNAGFGTTGTLVSADATQQRAMLTLHVEAVHRLTRAALPGMLAARRGGVIVVASVAGFLSSGGNVNYCATKTWQRVFVQGLHQELAGSGVHVQALCPGFTTTEFHARMGFDQRGRTPAWMWYPAEFVVRASLDAIARGGPVIVIPGAVYKAVVFLARHLPLWMVERLNGVYRRDTV
ncbi:MAG: SDR family oxidoreductase [Gemmatimonadaceae bacterium]|jgi:hypothetical protein|nr:SDR family oxidoreductase [Gemmatimonadaceae bacterium]